MKAPELEDLRGKRLRARVLSSVDSATLRWHEDCVLTIDDRGRITSVGEGGDESGADLDLRSGVLSAGFVDAHLHFPQTRIIGAASGPLLEWLEQSTFPEEARFASTEHAAAVAVEFVDALAAAGTTLSMVYGSVHPDACAALFTEVEGRGLRVVGGPVLMDTGAPEQLLLSAERALPALEELVARWHGRAGRIELAVMPRFALACSGGLLRGAGELARRHNLRVSTHLSENLAECEATVSLHGVDDYLAVYEEAGLVHERSVLAHCIHLSDREWDRLAAAGAVVAHCPDSNDFLGSGGMPRAATGSRRITVALGTDVAAGRTFRIPRIASSAHDNGLRQGHRLSPEQLWWEATRGGAAALGHPEQGAIEPGFEADLVLHEVPAWAETAQQVVSWLLFGHDAGPVAGTWVQGQRVG